MTGTQELTAALPDQVGSINHIQESLRGRSYVADRSLATALFLALRLGKPLLLEGEAGVGKTEVAKTMADLLATDLIRLQCYEGLDVNHAVYEWNYAKQMLEIRMLEAEGAARDHALQEIFGPEFLIKRPLLQAIEYTNVNGGKRPVLLIDEIDRADEEFEAFLLELLSDFQITVPEIGTLKATTPPVVIITSNRTRELHDALKRRCLYHWIDYPSIEKEEEIIAARLPEAPQTLAQQISRFMHELRQVDLYKVPGVAETLDWASALVVLEQQDLRPDMVDATLGAILKHQEDVTKVSGDLSKQLLAAAANGE
ncbi:MAG: AAA family ATPase [Thermomicrobiales bacterium]|jgi:MoxR-like ATPase|nr:MoxR family ATPase [Thermomicrobiales bacterium]